VRLSRSAARLRLVARGNQGPGLSSASNWGQVCVLAGKGVRPGARARGQVYVLTATGGQVWAVRSDLFRRPDSRWSVS